MSNLKWYESLKQEADDKNVIMAAFNLSCKLRTLLKVSKDDHLKAALKASDYKPTDIETDGFFESLQFISHLAQYIRFASVFHALDKAEYRYQDLDRIKREADDSWFEHYKLPVMGYVPNAKIGVLEADHLSKYNKKCVSSEIDYKLVKCLKKPLAIGLDTLYPKTRFSKNGRDSIPAAVKNTVKHAVQNYGINDVELNIDCAENNAVLDRIAQSLVQQESELKASDLSELRAFTDALYYDIERVEAFLQNHGDAQGKGNKSEVEGTLNAIDTYKNLVIDQEGGFYQQLQALPDVLAASNKLSITLNDAKNSLDEHHTVHPITGVKYDYVRLAARYTGKASDLIKQCGSNIDVINADLPVLDPELKAAYIEISLYNDVVTNLLENKVALCAADGLDGAMIGELDINKKINDFVDLAKRCMPEIDKSLYCALKRSGKYGPQNLVENFAVASQYCPLHETRESTLEQLNTLMRVDLEMNGWQGELPDEWDSDKMPSHADLRCMRSHPFTWLSQTYGHGRDVSMLEILIPQDLQHRAAFLTKLCGVLIKAKPHVSPALNAEIDEAIDMIGKDILPHYKELAEKLDIDFIALGKKGSNNNNATTKLAAN